MPKDFIKVFDVTGLGQASFELCMGEKGPAIRCRIPDRDDVEQRVTFGPFPNEASARAMFDKIDEAQAASTAWELSRMVEQAVAKARAGENADG